MKKTLLLLLLTLCMVLCFAAFTASAEETEHAHCVCGGNAVNVGDHTTCEAIVYTPISEALTAVSLTTQTVDFGKLPSGNYYLDTDIHVTASTSITKNKTINICLNGNHITTASDKRTIQNIKMGTVVNFGDCQGQLVDGKWVGGSVTGGTSTYGPITYTHAGSTLNIFGGAWKQHATAAKPRYGGLIVVAMDSGTDITGDEKYDSSDYSGKNLAHLNLYNGELSGGQAARGGNVYLMHASVMNMYGGIICDGTTVYMTNGCSKYPARGGNMYMDSAATFNMHSGVIANGTATKYSVDNTADNGQGGNIFSFGKVNISGGDIYGGLAEHNPSAKSTTAWNTSTPGRGGNIFMGNSTAKLTITGGNIYDGKANGIGGGNIWFQNGTFNMSGGKIWGGMANADKDEAATSYLRYAYDVCGGSIRIDSGTFNMTGGSIGINAEGKPAGGTNYPSGSEAGNLYVYDSAVANLSGGTIAYGDSRGKGGNLGGSGTINVSGTMVIRDGHADSYGGNWTLYNNGKCSITGGTISGGTAANGGNISIDGNNDTANALNITGGTITGGTATTGNGGNILLQHASKLLNVSGSAIISDGSATKGHGGNIYTNGAVTLTDTVQILRGKALAGNGGNIYMTTSSTLDISKSVQIKDGTSKNAGGNIYLRGNTVISGNAIVSGGTSNNSSSGNIYMLTGTLTLKDNVQILGGTCKNEGGNIAVYSTLTVQDNVVISGGTAGTSGGNLYVDGSSGKLIITGGTISDGTATNYGGNVYFEKGGTLENVTLSGGTAGKYGGNIYSVAGGLTMTDCTLTGGTATSGGSVFVETDGLTMTNTSITGATATERGGNIYNTGALSVTGGSITDGTASNGGNIYTRGGTVTMNGTSVTGGKANLMFGGTSTDGFGGNLYLYTDTTTELTNCTIANGVAVRHGGNIYQSGAMTINGGTITDGIADNENKKSTNGGNIYSCANLSVTNATISGGQATHGGNFYLDSGTCTFTSCTISDGKANLKSDGSTNGNGGNIISAANADTTITDCTISGGEAMRAGSVGAWGDVIIENTTITGGHAVYNGGNIMTYSAGQLTLKGNTVLSKGSAGSNGAAIGFGSNAGKKYIIEDGVEIHTGTGSSLSNCIYISGGDLTITGAPVIDQIYMTNSTDNNLYASGMTNTTPIEVAVAAAGAFAISDTDKSASFVSPQGYVIAYRNGNLYMDAPTAVYVSNSGDNNNNGSQAAPYKTVDHALKMVAQNGTITIVDIVDVGSLSKHSKSAVITGGEFNITAADRLELQDNLHFTNTIFTMPKQNYFIYCNGFKTVIDSDVTVRYLNGTAYTTDSTTSYIYGGSRAAYTTTNGDITGTDLTVMSGVWGYIFGGNNENVDMTGDVHLTVGGKVNQGVDYVSHTYSSKYLIIGGSRNADIHGTIYMTVKDGTTGTSINGGSNGECHVDKVELHVTGGEGMAIYGGGRGGVQTIDTINFYYEGGTFEQVFGGSLSYCLTGNVNLYITGGKITRRVYGGCYSNCDESSGNWTADNFVTGNVNLFIGSGATISCDLTDPNPGWEVLLTGGKYADRGIYGHSRRAAPGSSDAENATIIFLDKAAYDKTGGKLTAQDGIMKGIMKGISAADLIYYLSWEADDTLDTISHKAVAVKDPATNKTGDASAYTKSVSMALSGTSFYYNGQAHTPATLTVSDNWDYEAPVMTYADNTAIGTATVTLTAEGYTVTATFDIVKKDDVAQVIVNGKATKYEYLQEAVDAVAKAGYMQLLIDCDEDITISKNIFLDLNGKKLTGKVTVAKDVILYGADASTDDYDCADGYGEITNVEGEGTVAQHYKATLDGRIRRYVTYTDPETGAKSFHRIYLGITSVSLRPGASGLGYKATIAGDDKVVEMMGKGAVSMTMWVDGHEEKASIQSKDMVGNRMTLSALVRGMNVSEHSDMALIAKVSVTVNGQVLETNTISTTLRNAILSVANAIDDGATYTEAQMSALYNLCSAHSEILSTWGEVMNHILNWTPATT